MINCRIDLLAVAINGSYSDPEPSGRTRSIQFRRNFADAHARIMEAQRLAMVNGREQPKTSPMLMRSRNLSGRGKGGNALGGEERRVPPKHAPDRGEFGRYCTMVRETHDQPPRGTAAFLTPIWAFDRTYEVR